MTDSLIWRRLILSSVLLAGLPLAACSSDGFVDDSSGQLPAAEEGNFAKSMLISMGAIDDPHPRDTPKFQPRPTLVVPPSRTLPTPGNEEATLASKNFPVDPEVRAEEERRERLKGGDGTGMLNNGQGSSLTLAQQQKYRDLPKADGVPQNTLDRDASRPLSPDELNGKAQAAALKQAEAAGSPNSHTSLLTPPADYRTPSDKAPLEAPPSGIAAMKPSWWPF